MATLLIGLTIAALGWSLGKLPAPTRRDRWDHGYDFTMAHRRMLPFLTWAGLAMAAVGAVLLAVDAASG